MKSEQRFTAETQRSQRNPFLFSSLRSLCLCGALSAFGCHQAHVAQPLTQEMMRSDADSQIDFWHAMTDQSITTNDEAFHGVLLYLDNTDDSTDYPGRVEALKSRKLLPPGFNQPADAAVQRGTLAVILCRALQIRGGVTMQVLPYSERYAVRELQFMSLYPAGSQQQAFSGNEYVGIIGRIEDYQRGNSGDKPASQMQGHGAPSGESETSPATSEKSNGG